MTPSQMSLGIHTSNFSHLVHLDEAADGLCQGGLHGDLLPQAEGNFKKYLNTKCFWGKTFPFFMFLKFSYFYVKKLIYC